MMEFNQEDIEKIVLKQNLEQLVFLTAIINNSKLNVFLILQELSKTMLVVEINIKVKLNKMK